MKPHLAFGIALLFITLPASADTNYQPPDFIGKPAVLPPGSNVAEARQLGLAEAVQMAVQNNLSVRLRKQNYAQVKEGIGVAKTRFEPTLTGTLTQTIVDSPPTTVQEGSSGQVLNSKSNAWSLALAQRAPTGTVFALDYTTNRSASSFGNVVSPLLYRTGATFRLTQPLLKGFAFDTDIPRADILRAEFSSESARQDVLSQLIATVRDVQIAYWDVVFALKTYQVRQGSLELAEAQLGLTRRQIDAGILPPSDMINAEGTLAQRRLDLVQVEADIAQRGDELRRVLNLPRELWSRPVLPLDAPRFDLTVLLEEESLSRALTNRPEWKKRKLDVDRAALDVKVASTDRFPQLDAVASYGLVGQQPTYRSALDQLASAEAQAWTAGVNLSWTPLNIGANAQLRAREAAAGAARTARDQQMLDLVTEIRAAIREVNTATKAVIAAGSFRELAERSLEAEQRKFLNGTSNNFFVAQRQADVALAQLSEVAAVIRHVKAMVAAQAAMGVLLEDGRVRVDWR